MKLNAHITQSQTNKGDLGEGIVTTPALGRKVWTTGDTSTNIADRSYLTFSASSVSDFGSEVAYRSAFIQRVFCSKVANVGGQTRFLYSTFFDTVNSWAPYVEPHEVPTMGQVSDYLLRPGAGNIATSTYFKGGLISKYVGEHFATDEQTFTSTSDTMFDLWGPDYYVGSPPAWTLWNNYSLAKKMETFLRQIINPSTSDAVGFIIHATQFVRGSVVTSSITTQSAKYGDLEAGKGGPGREQVGIAVAVQVGPGQGPGAVGRRGDGMGGPAAVAG